MNNREKIMIENNKAIMDTNDFTLTIKSNYLQVLHTALELSKDYNFDGLEHDTNVKMLFAFYILTDVSNARQKDFGLTLNVKNEYAKQLWLFIKQYLDEIAK